jgi:pyridoxal phosphate enzyme (YggS family)
MNSRTAGDGVGLRERLDKVNARIETTARSAGRAPQDISLIAVGKTHPSNVLTQAIEAGVLEIGENRVQEADTKIEEIGRDRVRWHLIGHLQANKARRAIQLFDVIHTLDSSSLARRLDRLCQDEARDELPVLIQIDLANETTKSGISEAELPELVATTMACERLKLVGLMTVPPFFEDIEKVRPYFRRLRVLRDSLLDQGVFGADTGALSMGMSHDFEVAIEEGATMVRVGTAIFGSRSAPAG